MKKFLVLCLMALFAVSTYAATDSKKKSTQTCVFVTDIDCEHCKNKILNNVPVLGKGIEDVQVDLPTKEVTVTFNPEKTNVETIQKNFTKIKVQAEPKVDKE